MYARISGKNTPCFTGAYFLTLTAGGTHQMWDPHSCEWEEVYTRKTGYTSSNIWRDTTITRTGKWHTSRNRQKEIETRQHNLANQNRTNKQNRNSDFYSLLFFISI